MNLDKTNPTGISIPTRTLFRSVLHAINISVGYFPITNPSRLIPMYDFKTKTGLTDQAFSDIKADTTLTISNIDIKDDEMTLKKGEVKSLLSSAINIANDVIGEDLNSIKDNFLTVFAQALSSKFSFMKNSLTKMYAFPFLFTSFKINVR